MSCLLAIDPGIKTLGWAFFEGGELRACGLSRVKGSLSECAAAHRENLDEYLELAQRAVGERMMKRRGRREIPDQDLMDVNLVTGHLAREWLAPEEWKGSVPKEQHQPRILARLSLEEMALVDSVKPKNLKHNAIDAVGIGLFALGRLGVGTWTTPTSSTRSTSTKTRKKRRSGARSAKNSPASGAKTPTKKRGGRATWRMPSPP